MSGNYLEPTFTQGFLLGQLSVLILLATILRYLFLDDPKSPFETASYFDRKKLPVDALSREHLPDVESLDWFNALLHQVLNVYRSKLRGDMPGIDGDEIARQRIEEFANRIRPAGFLDEIKIHSVDLGVAAPMLFNARAPQNHPNDPTLPQETEFDAIYEDTVSLSLSTSYLFNYPTASFARLPISLTISLSQFKSSIRITPPSPDSPAPVLTFSISPNFVLDLTTTSLMGSRAKLANVPKLHELIQHQVRRVLGARATWKVVLPGLSSVAEVKQEMRKQEGEHA